MTGSAHLWAIGYPDAGRAEQVRANIGALSETHCLDLLETAVAVRFPDGSVTLDGIPFVPVPRLRGRPLLSFLAGLALAAPPLTHAAVGTLLSAVGTAPAEVGISEEFVREVEGLMAPGTSVLFVLDRACDMAAILEGIQGLGGTVLKTNVDLERARLIQATLLAPPAAEQQEPDGRRDDSVRS
jgi:uncharacterized membrane protein